MASRARPAPWSGACDWVRAARAIGSAHLVRLGTQAVRLGPCSPCGWIHAASRADRRAHDASTRAPTTHPVRARSPPRMRRVITSFRGRSVDQATCRSERHSRRDLRRHAAASTRPVRAGHFPHPTPLPTPTARSKSHTAGASPAHSCSHGASSIVSPEQGSPCDGDDQWRDAATAPLAASSDRRTQQHRLDGAITVQPAPLAALCDWCTHQHRLDGAITVQPAPLATSCD